MAASAAAGPATRSGLTPAEEQEKWLQEANAVVKQQAYAMKRALDTGEMMEALKHAANMLGELRTSVLSPSNYYSLYMRVMDELLYLEGSVFEEHNKKKRIAELYELVQHCGNVLPRLYLLVTVGSAYIKSQEAPAKHVLRDLVEMCRGVQHPTRGLFLRDYLTRRCKDKLPDKGNQYESASSGSTRDSVEFILTNFVEMNKLWVRMQNQVNDRDRDREQRERERRELCTLVGFNLHRIAQLDGVNVDLYKELVLPRVLEQVVNCKDAIAQHYLVDVMIMAFPDEYHLATLETLLGVLPRLEPEVDVKALIGNFIARLLRFLSSAEHAAAVPPDLDVFSVFLRHCTEIVDARNLGWSDVFALAGSLLSLALGLPSASLPQSLAVTDRALGFAVGVMQKRRLEKVTGRQNVDQLVQLLTKPLDVHTPVTVLGLDNYGALMPFLDYPTRLRVAKTVAGAVIRRGRPLREPEKVSRLFSFLGPLMSDERDATPGDEEDFAEEQGLVARLVHLVDAPDTDTVFQMLSSLRDMFKAGGERRARYTYVPLVFEALRLARRVRAAETEGRTVAVSTKRVLQMVYEVSMLVAPLLPAVALPLFLQAAHVAAAAGFEPIAYEFVTQALTVYENDFGAKSKEQFEAVALIAGALHAMRGLSAENYDTAALRVTQHAARLLRKEDQSRAVCLCAHLFWHDDAEAGPRDPKLVLQCMQKAIQKADAVMDGRVKAQLFVDILNHLLYFFARDAATAQAVQQAVVLVNSNLAGDTPEATRVLARNTFAHIKALAATDAKYREIDVTLKE